MKIKKAGLFDVFKLNKIIVDDRRMFDSQLFDKGKKPNYTTWFGLKKYVFFLLFLLSPRRHLFFVTEGKKVIGAATLINNNFIEGFFINKEYRGKGIGKMLMNYLFSFVRKKSKNIVVQVEIINKKAIEFYKNCGFKQKSYILEKRF